MTGMPQFQTFLANKNGEPQAAAFVIASGE
jgi:hypothetical protein